MEAGILDGSQGVMGNNITQQQMDDFETLQIRTTHCQVSTTKT